MNINELFATVQPFLTVLNTALIVTGLIYTIRHYKLNRTWSYIERYNSSDFILTRKYATIFYNKLNAFATEEEKREYVIHLLDSKKEEDIITVLHLIRFINLFTELGVAYKSNAWSKKAIISISFLVLDSWEQMQIFIKVQQERAHPRVIYSSFEHLYNDIIKRKLHL